MLARHVFCCVWAVLKSGLALSRPAGWRFLTKGRESHLALRVTLGPGADRLLLCWPLATICSAPALTAAGVPAISARRCCRLVILIGREVSAWPKKRFPPETRRGAGLLAKGRRFATPARRGTGRATFAGECRGVGLSRRDPGQLFPAVISFAEWVQRGGDIASSNFSARELHRQVVASGIAIFNFLVREQQFVTSDIASFNVLARELQLIEELDFDDIVRRQSQGHLLLLAATEVTVLSTPGVTKVSLEEEMERTRRRLRQKASRTIVALLDSGMNLGALYTYDRWMRDCGAPVCLPAWLF